MLKVFSTKTIVFVPIYTVLFGYIAHVKVSVIVFDKRFVFFNVFDCVCFLQNKHADLGLRVG